MGHSGRRPRHQIPAAAAAACAMCGGVEQRRRQQGDLVPNLKLSDTFIRSLPKVLLHDHLDGGLRPQTAIELAKDQGYTALPTTDAGDLAKWFHRGAQRGSLPVYLEGFAHTCGVMQTEESLERVAYEMMEEMREDGVVYVETRFAPVFHTARKLHWDDVVSAVLKGLERGKRDFGVEY